MKIQAAIAAIFLDFWYIFKPYSPLVWKRVPYGPVESWMQLVCVVSEKCAVSLSFNQGLFYVYYWKTKDLSADSAQPLLTIELRPEIIQPSKDDIVRHDYQMSLTIASGPLSGDLNETMVVLFSLFNKYRMLQMEHIFEPPVVYDTYEAIKGMFTIVHPGMFFDSEMKKATVRISNRKYSSLYNVLNERFQMDTNPIQNK